ncbi:MAG: DUF3040 domain-containing protein [Actinomycetota bacterium]
MAETKTTEEVLQEIERDLRADERIWKRVDRDLATLGGHPRRRTDLIVAGVIGIVVLLAGAFAFGWNLAPSTSGATVAVRSSPMRVTTSGLAEKRLALTARYGTSESAVDPGLWPPAGGGTGSPLTASGLAEKQRAFHAVHGGSESASGAPVMASPPMTRADFDAWRDYIRSRYGTGAN